MPFVLIAVPAASNIPELPESRRISAYRGEQNKHQMGDAAEVDLRHLEDLENVLIDLIKVPMDVYEEEVLDPAFGGHENLDVPWSVVVWHYNEPGADEVFLRVHWAGVVAGELILLPNNETRIPLSEVESRGEVLGRANSALQALKQINGPMTIDRFHVIVATRFPHLVFSIEDNTTHFAAVVGDMRLVSWSLVTECWRAHVGPLDSTPHLELEDAIEHVKGRFLDVNQTAAKFQLFGPSQPLPPITHGES